METERKKPKKSRRDVTSRSIVSHVLLFQRIVFARPGNNMEFNELEKRATGWFRNGSHMGFSRLRSTRPRAHVRKILRPVGFFIFFFFFLNKIPVIVLYPPTVGLFFSVFSSKKKSLTVSFPLGATIQKVKNIIISLRSDSLLFISPTARNPGGY